MSKRKSSTEIAPAVTQNELEKIAGTLPSVRTIITDGEYNLALKDYKLVGAIVKNLKQKKDSVLDPLKEAVKNLNAIFKPFEDRVKTKETELQEALNDFIRRRNIEREQELLRIENDKRLKNPVTIQQKIHDAGATPDSTFRMKVVNIINEDQVPKAFFDINLARIKNALLAGITVPGTELVEEVRIRR
jgi:hypothetical protein